MQNFVFTVSCERIPRRQAYYLRFPINDQLAHRIKELPEDTRKWNSGMMLWEVSTQSLYSLIRKYRGSTKIHFDFGSDESRRIFIDNIRKIEVSEQEKRNFIVDLNIKKENWVKYKQELEETYIQYSDKMHALLNDGIKLYPHQIVAAMFMNVTRNTLISHEMGLGKAQPLDSKLVTPNGLVRMGDIRVDDKVIGSDGKSKTVLGVYPQGLKDIYEITFSDDVTVRSCDEHLWNVNTLVEIQNENSYQTKTLRQIIDSGLYLNNDDYKWYVPMIKSIEFEEKILKVKPYVLGYLLGVQSEGIINDCSILDADINQVLTAYNLNCYDLQSKFIPNDFKFSSIIHRLELMHGVIDINGQILKNGEIGITSISKQFILDLQFITQSLGGIGRLDNSHIQYDYDNNLEYRLYIKLPLEFMHFNQMKYDNEFNYQPRRAITGIKYVGKMEAQCIMVDSEDHLYSTDNCILTHNTLSSILYIEMNGFEKVIVITPNSLKFNFYGEVEKFTKSNAHIVNWKKNKCSIEDAKYIIVNYDYFNPSSKEKFLTKWKKLNIHKIDAIICDESQKLKNTKSNTSKNFSKTFKNDIFREGKVSKIFLSGTPAPNRAYELYSVLHQISPVDFATKKYFYEYYCGMSYDIDGGWGYVQNMETKFEELYNKISPYTHRKRKFEVLHDLPDKIYQKIMLEMSDSEYAIYNDIENNVVNEFMTNPANNPLTIMIRLRQYTATLKIKHIIELVENILETGEKVVIVDYFKDSLYAIYEQLKNISALHTGDQTVEERSDIVKKFQDPNSDLKIFIGSIQTCNYGLTLTAASKLFIITLPYSVGEYDQVSDRLHRIGQKNVVNIYPLIFKDTIDEYVFSAIENKRKEITKVIDNEDYTSNVSESVLTDVIDKIKKKHGK